MSEPRPSGPTSETSDQPTSPHPPSPTDDPAGPACWSWELPTQTEEEVRADLASRTGERRLSQGTIDMMLSDWPSYQFDEFHDGRCAICGWPGMGALVIDHDHATGLVRGMLCRSCNTSEAVSRGDIYAMYRQRNPASILGYEFAYDTPGLAREIAPVREFDRWKDNAMANVGL